MSTYKKNMLKKVNHKMNVQAVPPPRPTVMNTEGYYPTQQQPMMMGNRGKAGAGNFSHKAPPPSTDLYCYFQCSETFKKDYDLRLHLKLRHRNEDPNEIQRAYQAAEEEIAFTKRSGSRFKCAICDKEFNNDHAMYEHTKKTHNIPWIEYKEKYGRCEVESAPFECKICGSVVKYTRSVVHNHIKQVHGLYWPQYLDRIRKMARGEQPDELPQIERFECQICNASVKYLKDHVWQVHRITEMEYEERLEQINKGLVPDELPSIETFECRICNATVKCLKEHIWNVHRLTEESYEERLQKMSRGEDPGELPSVELVECKVCNVTVKLFRNHLRLCHKITLGEYEELFA